jgi:hypothetical protein
VFGAQAGTCGATLAGNLEDVEDADEAKDADDGNNNT